MISKNVLKVAGVVLVGTAGAAFADVTTVACEGYTITLSEEDTMAIKEATGDMFEKDVCMVSSELNIAAYETPTSVRVTLSNGNEYDVMVQQKSQ